MVQARVQVRIWARFEQGLGKGSGKAQGRVQGRGLGDWARWHHSTPEVNSCDFPLNRSLEPPLQAKNSLAMF